MKQRFTEYVDAIRQARTDADINEITQDVILDSDSGALRDFEARALLALC
jgi:hypothetical protein